MDSLFWFALVTPLMGFLWLILGKSQKSLRNVRFITHTLSYCSALKIFCFATSSFAFAVAAAVAIYKFLLSGRFGIWQEQAKKDSERNFEILKIRKLLIDLHGILFNSVQFIIQRLYMDDSFRETSRSEIETLLDFRDALQPALTLSTIF